MNLIVKNNQRSTVKDLLLVSKCFAAAQLKPG